MDEIWYVYSWRYSDNQHTLYHEACFSKEEATNLYNEILDRGEDWDAMVSREPPESFDDIW